MPNASEDHSDPFDTAADIFLSRQRRAKLQPDIVCEFSLPRASAPRCAKADQFTRLHDEDVERRRLPSHKSSRFGLSEQELVATAPDAAHEAHAVKVPLNSQTHATSQAQPRSWRRCCVCCMVGIPALASVLAVALSPLMTSATAGLLPSSQPTLMPPWLPPAWPPASPCARLPPPLAPQSPPLSSPLINSYLPNPSPLSSSLRPPASPQRPPLQPPISPQPASPPGWEAIANLNCYEDHGGISLEFPTFAPCCAVADAEMCIHRCRVMAACTGVVVTKSRIGEAVQCYRRSWLDPTRCQFSRDYDTYILYIPPSPPSPPAPPPAAPVCSYACVENVLPAYRLPTLSAANTQAEAAWHAYVAQVYHQSVGDRVLDLQKFTWFYRDRRRDLIDSTPCMQVCVLSLYETYKLPGTPWIGTEGPEGPYEAGVYGFFVHRPYISIFEAERCERLEVFHVATSWLGNGGEIGVSWFFHTIGSGVFLDCVALRASGRGRIKAFHDRSDAGFASHDSDTASWMRKHGYAAVIYTKGWGTRTEIIVMHATQGHSELWGDRGACLDDPGIGIPLRTGFDGSLPCVCEPQYTATDANHHLSSVNCDGTPFHNDPEAATQALPLPPSPVS